MNILKKNRRSFLKTSLAGAAGLTAGAWLSSCSSFDDYLFEDRYSFKDEVIIIGGGIAGLYLAHRLRGSKTEFRVFEGSNFFGGRIRSNNGADYGASLIAGQDVLTGKLIDELVLPRKSLDKEHYYLESGLQALPDALVERISGLIPYRNLRLRWKLIEIAKLSSGYELLFEAPSGQKKFVCRKLALALPPSQWGSVKGLLELPDMSWAAEWLKGLQVQNSLKLILPASASPGARPLTFAEADGFNLRQIAKKTKSGASLEIDVQYPAAAEVSLEVVFSILKKKLQINFPPQKLTGEQFYDWNQVQLIRGAFFRNPMALPESKNYNFQIVGDFAAVKSPHTVEGALESAEAAARFFL